jgi:mannose-P-dolichol utilization defect 1
MTDSFSYPTNVAELTSCLAESSCSSLFISKSLGYAIVVGASIVKVPQILKIVSAGSVQGLSLLAILLETYCYMILLAFSFIQGFPFSTYGESFLLTLQNAFIIYLLFKMDKNRGVGLSFLLLVVTASAFTYYLLNVANVSVLALLQKTTIVVGTASKLPQIWANFTAKSTGQLSFITVFLIFGGSAARVFTTLKEVDDMGVLLSYVLASTLNGFILLQCLLYGSSSSAAKPVTAKKKTN